MAQIIQDKDLEKDDNKPSLQAPNNNMAAPQNSAQPPQTQPANPNQPSRVRQQGTGFTNINRVVQANQNNRLGQAVAGGVQQNVGRVQQGLQQARDVFEQQSQQNRLGTQEQAQQRQDFLNRAVNNPSQVTDADVQASQKFLTGRYGGPQGLQNAEMLVGNARDAETLGQLAGSTAGRSALLSRFAGGQGYTQGQSRLDNILLGTTAGNELNQARRQAMGTGQQALNTAQGAQNQAQQFGQEAQRFGQETAQQLGLASSGIQGQVQNQLQAAQDAETKRQASSQKIQSILAQADAENDPRRASEAIDEAAAAGIISPQQVSELKNQLTIAGLTKDLTPTGGMLNDIENATYRTYNFLKDKDDKTPAEWGRMRQLEADLGNLRSLKSQALQGGALSSQNILRNLVNRVQSSDAQNLSASGLANEQQRAQLNALSRLSGQTDQFTPETGQFKAGTLAYDPTVGQFDAQALLNNLGEFGTRYLDDPTISKFYGNRRIT